MLSLRVASAVVWVPLLFGVAYLGGIVYAALVTLATLAAAWEVRTMLRAAGHRPFDMILLGLATALPLHAFLGQWWEVAPFFEQQTLRLLGIAVLASFLMAMLRGHLDGALVDWALSLAPALYLGGLMQFYAPLRDRPDGVFWVIAAVGLSFVCDTSAFFAGRALGRTPLAPHISPGKSLEGAIAGVLGSVLVGALAGLVSGHGAPVLAGYGLVIALATITGDLAESLLKRQTGVKDSGALVPGHGGLLDRMDSLLFCAPVAVFYLGVFQ